MIKKIAIITTLILGITSFVSAQNDNINTYAVVDYNAAKTYIVAGFEVT
jgi:hypothetical protein